MAPKIPKDMLDWLALVPLLSSCTKDQLRTLAGQGTTLSVDEGRVLTEQGGLQEEFFMVLAGEARCLVDGKEVARFGPGDFFGEMTLLDRGARTATVIADTPMDLLVLERNEFRTVVENAPDLAWRLLTGLAARLRTAQASHTD
jgi:CRP/FNR family transcriptional regulator, cyclic AMP receptor protein